MRGLIFDLDGTLVDTVYAHVFAWQRAFAEAGLAIDGWRIHRRIGMSGGLFARAAARELGHDIDASAAEDLQRRHGELFREFLPERRPLPGAVELLRDLRRRKIAYGIATSGRRPEIDRSRQTRAGPVHRLRAATRGCAERVLRRRRCRLGSARGAPRGDSERRAAEWRLRGNRAPERRSLSRLPRSGRTAALAR